MQFKLLEELNQVQIRSQTNRKRLLKPCPLVLVPVDEETQERLPVGSLRAQNLKGVVSANLFVLIEKEQVLRQVPDILRGTTTVVFQDDDTATFSDLNIFGLPTFLSMNRSYLYSLQFFITLYQKTPVMGEEDQYVMTRVTTWSQLFSTIKQFKSIEPRVKEVTLAVSTTPGMTTVQVKGENFGFRKSELAITVQHKTTKRKRTVPIKKLGEKLIEFECSLSDDEASLSKKHAKTQCITLFELDD